MAITRLTKHELHPVTIRLCCTGPHYAELRCAKCNKHIQWLNQADYKRLQTGKEWA